MLPVVAARAQTGRQILLYTVALVPVTFAPVLLGFAGLAYGLVAVVTGAAMVALAWRVWAAHDEGARDQSGKRLFAFSILHLFLLFAMLLVDWSVGGAALHVVLPHHRVRRHHPDRPDRARAGTRPQGHGAVRCQRGERPAVEILARTRRDGRADRRGRDRALSGREQFRPRDRGAGDL